MRSKTSLKEPKPISRIRSYISFSQCELNSLAPRTRGQPTHAQLLIMREDMLFTAESLTNGSWSSPLKSG